MKVIYEDNHILVVNKEPGEIVQGDKTGDQPLSESLKIWLKEKYSKPGNVFLGVVHRLDRPVGGLVIFAKTSKALTRLNDMLRDGKIHKTYLAVTRNIPPATSGELHHYIRSDARTNKSYASSSPKAGAKEAKLRYRHVSSSDRYHLLEIDLLTGRKHQIRVQLASMGCPIRGDLKYGDKRSNPDGSISLMSWKLDFVHPVSGEHIILKAPVPDDQLWKGLAQGL
ncbi:RluA family pseudouridine synthase [uncultured Duncaniella sp.]|jgi:Pseudouridylate synthases, 23S RNA-specific|uniref:RluA family pseudouridine synthase n=1 Tax=uncultured Duncaniella sp. TaxID=2768039 RepID=UPI002711E28C|nr:RluA family pseudouridine synthase [uncultured Duncaniella sp.]MCX4258400.1 RluA family pseudouridine synthase [Muribaculaceae bacterium]